MTMRDPDKSAQNIFVSLPGRIVCSMIPLLLAFGGCRSDRPRLEMIGHNGSLEPLRRLFNAEKDRPRILAVLSPT